MTASLITKKKGTESIGPLGSTILNYLNVQYCAKEMQAKFAEISEITRISAIKLRTRGVGR